LDVTDESVALKAALLAPAGIAIEAGKLAAALLLDKVTACPPVAAEAFRATVQEVVAGPTTELLAHERVLTAGTPAPVRLIAVDELPEELLEMVSVPAAEPAMAGLKPTVSAVDWPGFSVIGKVTPETL
jgi:hypothetical protein